MNGTSVVENGVANVPIARSQTPGVIKVFVGDHGVQVSSNGILQITSSKANDIKAGTQSFRPIAPNRQHESTFYGLAKAAGDTTQSSSNNTVGTYTDDAKVAIQKMLGIYEPPWELLNDITLSEIGGIDLTADDNGVPYNLLSVYMYIYYPANAESISSGYSRIKFYSGDSVANLNAETGRYITATAPKFKIIFVDSISNLKRCLFTRSTNVGDSATLVTKLYDKLGSSSVLIDFGNITRIAEATNDTEPAGTRFMIYGRRAY